VSYADILPIERNISTGFHHWVLGNPKVNKHLSNPHRFVTYDKNNIIFVDLNLFSQNYQKKFIEPNAENYFNSFISKTEYILYTMMSVYKMKSFKVIYHFHLGSIIYPKEVFYFFLCKLS
jgi:hypothetical protein